MNLYDENHITLDLSIHRVVNVSCSHDDMNSRKLYIRLTNDGKEYPIDSSDTSISVKYKLCKADNKFIYNNVDAIMDNGEIFIDLTDQCTSYAGIAHSELQLIKNATSVDSNDGQVISSMPFNVIVKPSVVSNDSIESTDEFGTLTELITENKAMNDSLKELEETLEENEEVRITAENQRRQAEINRIEAERDRVSNEDARRYNESVRKSNEDTRIANEENRESNELNRQKEEGTRKTNEETRQYNESVRNTREAERIENEDIRQTNEEVRQAAESLRQQTFETNEEQRQATFDTNETNRQNTFNVNEADRQNEFDTNETDRRNTFNANETSRQDTFNTNEEQRQNDFESSETERQTTFNTNENNRQNEFDENESVRQSNEAVRIANEDARIEAEKKRETDTASVIESTNEAKSATETATANAITATNDLRELENTVSVNEEVRQMQESNRQTNTQTAIEAVNIAKEDAEVATQEAITTTEEMKELIATNEATLETMKTELEDYADKKVTDLVNGAPETMNTLGEIADAMNEYEEVVEALDAAITNKANASDLTSHVNNTTSHITSTERSTWNSKANADGSNASGTWNGKAKGVDGVLPVENGGTGKSTLVDAANELINSLSTGDSVPQDTDCYISQYVNGDALGIKTYHRRPLSRLWEYIQSKISSILGLTASSYGGNAATATNASKVNNHTVNADVPAGAKFTDTLYTHPNSGVTAGTYRNVTVNAAGHVTAGSNPTVTVAQGGTGQTTIPNTLKSYFPNSLTTGSVALLGTGWDNNGYISIQGLRNSMGLGNTTGALPVANGGTGATDAATARSNLGITPANIGAAAASHGTHVPSVCTTITDWNSATSNGWYMAYGASNAPSTVWYMGYVIAHNANYVIQEVWSFTSSTDIYSVPKYTRVKMNGTWGAWKESAVARASKLGRNGDVNNPMTFNWSGQSGQPTWLWGGSDGTNMYVYNPSNFSVNYATSAGSATSATKATYVVDYADSSNTIQIGFQGASESVANTSYAAIYNSSGNIKDISFAGFAEKLGSNIISSSSSVTATARYALDAREKNASISGTLANQIAATQTRTSGTVTKNVTFTTFAAMTYVYKVGKVVTWAGTFVLSSQVAANTAIATLPTGFRPIINTPVVLMLCGYKTLVNGMINTAGQLYAANNSLDSGYYHEFSVTFLTD